MFFCWLKDLTAIQYEKERGRFPEELSEQPGYDIESISEDEVRYIEVKGKARFSRDIFLTANEFVALKNNSEVYFVYVVTGVLKDPNLHVASGKDLLEIDPKVIIPTNQWQDKTGGFRPLHDSTL